SNGCRSTSSVRRLNSGSSSKNSTPLWLNEISPGVGIEPPPTSPASLRLSKCAEIDISFTGDDLVQIPAEIVDTRYVAQRLDCTQSLVRRLARSGEIPETCVLVNPSPGEGWRFDRESIDAW